MKLYLKLNNISDSMIVFQNRQNSQILIQFNPLLRMRAKENLRACKNLSACAHLLARASYRGLFGKRF